ncbi:class I SAM-dependent methyltransferase [Streptomyces sp. NPDC048142]|uniref:class I SAM-dependent methyltransferase n=1 Tax=Streptomyces sp. NPDC048142 TaxID=3365501 RepID=UPI00371684BB
MRISADVLAVLSGRTEADGHRLTLVGPRLPPTLYQRVNEVLEAVGGRWTKSEGAHLFPVPAAEVLAPVLATGEVVTPREKRTLAQYFPTPAPVVDRLIALAALEPGMTVLEPSAGSGAIATAAAARGAIVDCIEQDPGYATALSDTHVARRVLVADFLTVPVEPRFHRVLMNPPFTRGTDMAHVVHVLRFLKPNGLLVSVMSWTVTEQTDGTMAFRKLVEQRGGRVEALPARAFARAGTAIDTVLVAIPATRPDGARPTVWPVRDLPGQDAGGLGSPADIAAEIVAALRRAVAAFEMVAGGLTRPVPTSVPDDIEVSRPSRSSKSVDGSAASDDT